MLTRMGRRVHLEFKIVCGIVEPIMAVFMMHDFRGKEVASKLTLHDQAVLRHVAAMGMRMVWGIHKSVAPRHKGGLWWFAPHVSSAWPPGNTMAPHPGHYG